MDRCIKTFLAMCLWSCSLYDDSGLSFFFQIPSSFVSRVLVASAPKLNQGLNSAPETQLQPNERRGNKLHIQNDYTNKLIHNKRSQLEVRDAERRIENMVDDPPVPTQPSDLSDLPVEDPLWGTAACLQWDIASTVTSIFREVEYPYAIPRFRLLVLYRCWLSPSLSLPRPLWSSLSLVDRFWI